MRALERQEPRAQSLDEDEGRPQINREARADGQIVDETELATESD